MASLAVATAMGLAQMGWDGTGRNGMGWDGTRRDETQGTRPRGELQAAAGDAGVVHITLWKLGAYAGCVKWRFSDEGATGGRWRWGDTVRRPRPARASHTLGRRRRNSARSLGQDAVVICSKQQVHARVGPGKHQAMPAANTAAVDVQRTNMPPAP